MKRLALLTATVGATLVGVWLLWQFHTVALLFALSLGLAAALRPLADRQQSILHWPRPAAVLTVYLLALAAITLMVWAASAPVLNDLRLATDRFLLTYDSIWAAWPTGTPLQQSLALWLPPPTALYSAVAGPGGAAIARTLLGATLSLADFLSRFAVVVVMSMYWSLDQGRLERLWLSLLPTGERTRALEIWRAIETGLGAYLRSELTQSFLAGLLLAVGYWLLGLPYPSLVAAISAVVWLIPWLGAILGLGLVLAAGLAANPWITLAACAYTVLVLAALQFGFEPRLYNRRQFSSLLVVLVVIALWDSAGLFGLLVAPPLAAALQILLRNLTTPSPIPVAGPVQARFAALEGQLANLDATLAITAEAPSPQVTSLVTRLGLLVAEARHVLLRRGTLPPDAAGDGLS